MDMRDSKTAAVADGNRVVLRIECADDCDDVRWIRGHALKANMRGVTGCFLKLLDRLERPGWRTPAAATMPSRVNLRPDLKGLT